MVEVSHLRDLFASISETTLPPALMTPAATGSKNGPVPATTLVCRQEHHVPSIAIERHQES